MALAELGAELGIRLESYLNPQLILVAARPHVPISPSNSVPVPRLIADYTSTSESGRSLASTADSLSSLGSPLDSHAHSPLDSLTSPPAAASPFPATRALPPPTDAAANRAQRLVAAMRARKAARAAAVLSPSSSAEEIATVLDSLDLNKSTTAPKKLYWMAPRPSTPPSSDVFSASIGVDAGAEVETAKPTPAPVNPTAARPATASALLKAAPLPLPAPPRPPPLSRVEPSNLPYFSVSRPLPGHFDRPPSVVYTRDAAEADDLVACLRGPLGFDLEWPPPGIGPVLTRTKNDGSITHYRAGEWDARARRYVWPQGRTAVIQLADTRTVVVYHLPKNGKLGPGLQAVLNDGLRVKTGVNVGNDGRKLWRDELVPNTAGLLELSHIAHLVDPEIWTRSARLISLARLTEHYLGVPLNKSEGIREGAWNEDLNAEQIEYAANDAYVGVLIYNALVARASERGLSGELDSLRQQITLPQFPDPVVELAQSGRQHPAVVAATRAGAKPRHSLALGLFVAGGSVADLASALSISTRTVQGYVTAAALLIPPDEYEGYVELAVRLVEAFPRDSYPAVTHAEFFHKLRGIANAVDDQERVPVHRVNEYEWGDDD